MKGPIRSLGLRGFVSSSVFGAFVGASAFTLYTSEGLAYLSDDPEACTKCHVMREHYDGWLKSTHHAAATCNGCHLPHETVPKYIQKAENGFWHSKGFTLQNFHEPIRIRPKNRSTLNANCLDCHQELVSMIVPGSGKQEDLDDCVRCHVDVGHGPAR